MKVFTYFFIFITYTISIIWGCKKENDVISPVVADSLFYTQSEAQMIFSGDLSQPFAVMLMSNQADSAILCKKSRNVKIINDTTTYLITRLYRTINTYQGNIEGIAAPEAGINRNIIIVKRKDKAGEPLETFINPVISQHSASFTGIDETCITRPGSFPAPIERYNLIMIEYYSADGTRHTEVIENQTAAIVQHLMAHLNGGIIAFYTDPLAFTGNEIDSIMSAPDSIPMRIILTTNYNDSLILRRTSTDVRPDTNDVILMALINRIRKALATTTGVGIAAPQVGINRNIIWVKRYDKPGKPFEVYLNPKITNASEKLINFANDGCLSIPNLYKTTVRHAAIEIEYDLPDGSHHSEIVEGYISTNFTAVIFQHEIDHLNGILFVDRAL